MTQVFHFPPSSPTNNTTSSSSSSSSPSSSSISLTCAAPSILIPSDEYADTGEEDGRGCCYNGSVVVPKDIEAGSDHLSLLALLLAVFRRSLVVCKSMERREICALDIGWPTNVRHVAHVTFDRFNGFLGLPVEFEPEVSSRAPSASATVFGVSTESMQLSFDSRGNSVPTILLLMQRHLYGQGGLQAEGIFRINGENSQEEYVRDQLNKGVIPDGVDMHCLAGLMKAWFRELPSGVLDPLSPEQVIQCQTEEDCLRLVRLLPATEGALLDWAVNLMADVAQLEHLNKMNARNIAMVFAPNMTQMADPLTALMYAVQVMNFLRILVLRTLREREDSVVENPRSCMEPFDENGDQSASLSRPEDTPKDDYEIEERFISEEPVMKGSLDSGQMSDITGEEYHDPLDSVEKFTVDSDQSSGDPTQVDTIISDTDACGDNILKASGVHDNTLKCMIGQSSNSNLKRGPSRFDKHQSVLQTMGTDEKTKGISNLRCINSRTELIEAWR